MSQLVQRLLLLTSLIFSSFKDYKRHDPVRSDRKVMQSLQQSFRILRSPSSVVLVLLTTLSPSLMVTLKVSSSSMRKNEDLYIYTGQSFLPITVISGNLINAGTYNANTNLLSSVTTAGSAAGFTNGAALPAPALATSTITLLLTRAARVQATRQQLLWHHRTC